MSISKALTKLLSKSKHKNSTVRFDFNDTLGDESGLMCPGGCGEPANWCSCEEQSKIVEELKKKNGKK